jgi:curved DNA-binding protein CbpA
MGNNQSAVDPVHVRMYSNMIQIQDPSKRIQVIQTCLASMEYVNSAKRCGIYSYLLHYLSAVQSGSQPPVLPGEPSKQQAPAHHTQQSAVAVPRSLQHNFVGGIGATHPSMINAPNASTYQNSSHASHTSQSRGSQQIVTHTSNEPTWKVITDTPKQKAISYFASCLEVLNIQEEVALTEESLKIAYKKMALRSHPDKGGSEEYFEAVTRAYAYLAEILKFMKGGKRDTGARVDASHMSQAQQSRDSEAKKWDYGGEPVRLNAKNLDMNAFNKLFEQTHMPDPDSDGYGDWLKDSNGGNGGGQKFKGEFNRDVFNRMFEDDLKPTQQRPIRDFNSPIYVAHIHRNLPFRIKWPMSPFMIGLLNNIVRPARKRLNNLINPNFIAFVNSNSVSRRRMKCVSGEGPRCI